MRLFLKLCAFHLLGMCHPALYGPDSSWDSDRVLHSTPPNELDEHDPSCHGLHPSRCSSLNSGMCFNSAISHAMRVLGTVFLPPTRQFPSRHTSNMAHVFPSSNDKTSFPRPQHEGGLRSSCVVSASSQANSVAHYIGTFRCITTGTSTTNLHCPLHCLNNRYLASHRHWHFGDSTRDTL